VRPRSARMATQIATAGDAGIVKVWTRARVDPWSELESAFGPRHARRFSLDCTLILTGGLTRR